MAMPRMARVCLQLPLSVISYINISIVTRLFIVRLA